MPKICHTKNKHNGSIALPKEEYDKIVKFRLRANIIEENGCWIWQGCKNNGYGQSSYRSRMMLTHRISWIVFNGEIPKGIDVCHKCDNPSCINPEHLFLGNAKDNVNDMWTKQRKSHKGEKHPRCKLTLEQVKQIRYVDLACMTQRDIAKKYGLTAGYIHNIKSKRTWKDV